MITVEVKVLENLPPNYGEGLLAEVKKLPDMIGAWMLTRTSDNWEAGKAPDGRSWAPLAKSTLDGRRRRNISSLKPLIATGAMKSSLRLEKTADSVAISIDDPAVIHQNGTKTIPKRELLPLGGIPDSWEKEIGVLVADRLKVFATE